MAFTGSYFIYDGIPSEEFGLMLGNLNNASQEVGRIGTTVEIQEDRIARRSAGIHYGVVSNDPKQFPLSFVVCDEAMSLDRYDIARVAAWLSGGHDYKELHIVQPDMEGIFYRCIITDLEQVEVGMRVVGLKATMTCDCPYAYRSMVPSVFSATGTSSVTYRNFSNVKDYHLPKMVLQCSGSSFSITNKTDGSAFTLSGMPTGERIITIDAQNQVMTSSDGLNLYQYWNTDQNKYFPRFVRGENELTLTGSGVLTIQNEFLWNIGH